MLTALEWSGLESDASSPTITVPSGATGPVVTGWDKAPPSAPTGFSAAREVPGQYRLKWTAPPDKDLRYFNLYFSILREARACSETPLHLAAVRHDAIPRLDRPDLRCGLLCHHGRGSPGNESVPAYASVVGGQP